MLTLPSVISNHQTVFHQRNPRFQIHNTRHPRFTPIHSSSLQEISTSSSNSNTETTTTSPFPPIKSTKRVVLVRHGQSTWNEEGRIQGSSNFSVLTQKGETQAQTSRQMLLNDTFDVCFASPLARSRRTAEVIWDDRQQEIISESELREIDLYSFQGLLKKEGKAKFGEAYLNWQKDAPNFKIDGHYPVRELWDRARNCWVKILKQDGQSILVVAHNAVNQALVSTAIGLDTDFFRILVQSNCGVTVLDFIPHAEGGSPHVCLNRLNQYASVSGLSQQLHGYDLYLQMDIAIKDSFGRDCQLGGFTHPFRTPYSPIATRSSDGRNSSKRIILACCGPSQRSMEDNSADGPLNMLGIIQSQKTAELLLDSRVSSIVCSTSTASIETAKTISKVQEAADCLGADNIPRNVELKQLEELEVESIPWQSKQGSMEVSQLTGFDDGVITEIWNRSQKVWKMLIEDLSDGSEAEENLVVVGHPAVHIALLLQSLNLQKERIGSFHLDPGSISVIDFPDGPAGRAVIRCVNYTEHLGRWSVPVTRSMTDMEQV